MAEDNIKNFIKMLSGKKDDSLNKRKIEAIRNYFKKEEEEFNEKYEKLDYRSYNKLLKKLQDNNLVSADEEKITEISVKKYFIKKSIKKYLILLTSIISILSPILIVNQNITRDEIQLDFEASLAFGLANDNYEIRNNIQRSLTSLDLLDLINNLNSKKIHYILQMGDESSILLKNIDNSIDHILIKHQLQINNDVTGDIQIIFND